MTRVMYGRDLIVATDIEVPYLHVLRNRFGHFPSIRIARLDLNSDDHLALRSYEFDTVVCLNVLEHNKDDEAALRNLRSEEHTSELQSHSFISYAVFCLKKK